jgi:signal transduction histidine kinase
VIAGLLTVAMLGWQGWHLYDSYRAVADRQAGRCPTKAAEEIVFAGQAQTSVVDELVLDVAAAGPMPVAAAVEWRHAFDAGEAVFAEAVGTACDLAQGDLAAAIEVVDQAHTALTVETRAAYDAIVVGDEDRAAQVLSGAAFDAARDAFTRQLDRLVSISRIHMEQQLRDERRRELATATVALGIFAAAVGAWGLFVRRIRRGQADLAAQQAERRRAERRLEEARRLRAAGLLAAGVAHDLSNLVSSIRGSTAAAAEHVGAGHAAMVGLRRVDEAAQRAAELADGLLAFSGTGPRRAVPVDLGAVVAGAVDTVANMMPPDVEVVISRPPQEIWVNGDPVQLRQVVVNLALNARDAMPGGGRVEIGLRASRNGSGEAVLEVRDEGSGMTSEVEERVFEPFFTTKADDGGRGLGLAVVHGIVTDHGGAVGVRGAAGRGAVFTVTLPATEPPRPKSASGGVQGGERVGLVMANRHIRGLTQSSLTAAGLVVAPYDDLAAMAEDADAPPNVVVIDVDGLEAASGDVRAVIEAAAREAAVLVVGGDPPALEGAGRVVVMRKPFATAELVAEVQTLATQTRGARVR